jgi:hypothetical protein
VVFARPSRRAASLVETTDSPFMALTLPQNPHPCNGGFLRCASGSALQGNASSEGRAGGGSRRNRPPSVLRKPEISREFMIHRIHPQAPGFQRGRWPGVPKSPRGAGHPGYWSSKRVGTQNAQGVAPGGPGRREWAEWERVAWGKGARLDPEASVWSWAGPGCPAGLGAVARLPTSGC